MNKFLCASLFILLIKFSSAQFTVVSWPPLPNTYNDFENVSPGTYSTATAIPGWSISSGVNPSPAGIGCGGTPTWTSGSPEFSVVSTPIFGIPYYGSPNIYSIDNVNVGASPLGGTQVIRMHDVSPGSLATRMQVTFTVNNSNSLFEIAYCGSWHSINHNCCDRPAFIYRILDAQGSAVNCYFANLSPGSASCSAGPIGNSVGDVTWIDWQQTGIDLSPFFGSQITIELINSDCNTGAHHGSVYVDIGFTEASLWGCPDIVVNPPAIPISFCSSSTLATISAPPGYTNYSWLTPANATLAPASLSLQLLSIPNPVAGDVYTVIASSPSPYYYGGGNCSFSFTYTLATTQVSIAAYGVAPSCSIGASGSASVSCIGSALGYNYTWFNQSNAAIGTNSVITNLSPGVYNVSVTALGSAGCGSAVTTVTIDATPNAFYSVIKPFCGNTATLDLPPNVSSIQWYDNNQPISAALGGTASVYAVSQPSNMQIFRSGYYTSQGCRDSLQYTLAQASAGSFSVTNISMACQGSSNATANLVINPSPMAFATSRSYSLFSIPVPGYTATASSFPSATFSVNNMPSGNYSVVASDGLCSYTSSFTVSEFIFDGLASPSATLCPGVNAALGVLFPNPINPNQYSFSWAPATNVVGSTNNIAILVTNTSVPNPALTVYSVVITPTVVNCPTTQTVGITFMNSTTPTVTPLQAICINSGTYALSALPAGGTFSTAMAGNWLNASGLISSSQFLSAGLHTVSYTSVGNCYLPVTSTIDVSTFNTASLTTSALNVCNTASCINLMTVVQNTSGVWTGSNLVSNFFCPLNVVSGMYTLTYNNASSPNPTACPNSQTLSINVTSPITPSISAVTATCNNSLPIQLMANPAFGSFVATGYLTNSGVFSPALASIGNNFIQYTGNCMNTATAQINVEAFVSAELIDYINPLCMNGNPIGLSSFTLNAGGNWSGNGVVGSVFSPSLAGVGNWVLTYSINSSPTNLCPSQSTMVAAVNPLPNLSIQGSTVVCVGLSNSLIGSGASSYIWMSPSLVTPVAGYSISISPSVSTMYNLYGTDLLGCSSQLSFSVNVIPCYVGINTLALAEQNLIVYPNPGKGEYYLESEADVIIRVTDALGRVLLKSECIPGKNSLDLSAQPNGIYFLQCTPGTITKTIKLVKE